MDIKEFTQEMQHIFRYVKDIGNFSDDFIFVSNWLILTITIMPKKFFYILGLEVEDSRIKESSREIILF